MYAIEDSSDATLALDDNKKTAAHKVVLAQIDESCKWASGQQQKLPYYLNERKIEDMIRMNATLKGRCANIWSGITRMDIPI